jgi:hypothetical protein
VDLTDLRKSVSTLSDEDLLGLLKGIRSNRRISKPKTESKKTTTQKPSTIGIDALLASASPDMIASLIATLEQKQGG